MKKNNMRWAVRTFILSISLSILFSVISQSLFPNLPAFLSIFVILFFIVVSVVFDMVGVGVTSASVQGLERHCQEVGYGMAVRLCQNTEKVSSFCGDVVGDICGILSGAGGISLVISMHITNASLYFVVTCLVSSLIAGLTIFGKAVMKGYAVDNCVQVVMKVGKFLEMNPLTYLKKKRKDGNNSKKSKKM